jgi:hypothetical protein
MTIQSDAEGLSELGTSAVVQNPSPENGFARQPLVRRKAPLTSSNQLDSGAVRVAQEKGETSASRLSVTGQAARVLTGHDVNGKRKTRGGAGKCDGGFKVSGCYAVETAPSGFVRSR